MIFFFGVKEKPIHTEHLKDQVCTHCGQRGTIQADFLARYVHCFWVPLFSIGKRAYTYCTHCKQTLGKKEMPVAYKVAVEQYKNEVKTPIWHYAGLLLFCFLVILFFSII